MSTEQTPPNPELLQKMDMSLDQIIQSGKTEAKPQRNRNKPRKNPTQTADNNQSASQPVRGRARARGVRSSVGRARLSVRGGRGGTRGRIREGRGGLTQPRAPRGMSPLRPRTEQHTASRGRARRAQVDSMRGVEYSDASKQQMAVDNTPAKPSYFQKRQGSFQIESSLQVCLLILPNRLNQPSSLQNPQPTIISSSLHILTCS